MKFTKENVEAVINEYFRQAEFESCGDLIAEIHNLDDTPEKVEVKKFVAEYIEETKRKQLTFKQVYKYINGMPENVWLWKKDHDETFARAWLNGYEVGKEPLYEVLLPRVRWNEERSELVTEYQKLLFDKTSEETRFVCREYIPIHNDYICKLTESEIKEIDERYWPFAVPAND